MFYFFRGLVDKKNLDELSFLKPQENWMSSDPNVPVTLSPFIDETVIENTLLIMGKYNSS